MIRRLLLPTIILITILSFQAFLLVAFAEEKPSEESAEYSAEDVLHGRVVDIVVEGKYTVKTSFIKRQLTIAIGDVIYQRDCDLSQKRLEKTGLFETVNIYTYDADDADEPVVVDPNLPEAPEGVGDVVLYVDVTQDTTAYVNPYESGLIIGDKDIFDSGHTLEGAYFNSGSTFEYWHLKYANPQFLGSHNTATFFVSRSEDVYGIRNEDTYELGEQYCIDQLSFKFNLTTLFKEDFQIDVGVERREVDTFSYAGKFVEEENCFFLSGENVAGSDNTIFSFYVSQNIISGKPWINEGYAWLIGTEQAFESIWSDSTFGRYSLVGTRYLPVDWSVADILVFHGEYRTTSGTLSHHQKPRLGYVLRGHKGMDYFGDSSVYLTGEARKLFWDDKMMGIAFIDLGRGFDTRKVDLKNLEMCTGLGVRFDMKQFWNWDVILRLDYAWGEFGTKWTFGIGQDVFGGLSDIGGGGQASGGCTT